MSESAPLYAVRREHLDALSDETGIMQHAIGGRPDPGHGYCTDDVARSLIVHLRHLEASCPSAVAQSAARALEFLWSAFDPPTGRFRNFRRVDGTWIEEVGSEDCHGRAIQACGESLARSADASLRQRAARLMEVALPAAMSFTALRPVAYTMLGCAAALDPRRGGPAGSADPSATVTDADRVLLELGGRLATSFVHTAGSVEWPWPEPILTYDNGVIARALIAAGRHLGLPVWAELGVQALEWLVRQLTTPDGHLSLVGNVGWWPRGGPRARFDQQPIDATSVLDAAAEAYLATRDARWSAVAERALAWFLGANDLGLPVADPERGACGDGLGPGGVNINQGAESTLAWLLAVERLREIRAGAHRGDGQGVALVLVRGGGAPGALPGDTAPGVTSARRR